MVRHEKMGAAIFLLILLIIVTPGIPTITGNSTLLGVSVNDSVLILLIIVVFAFLGLIFVRRKPDMSTSNAKFKRFYQPKSDLNRLSQYAQERAQAGDSNRKVQAGLLKVGWDKELIQHAINTSEQNQDTHKSKIQDLRRKKVLNKLTKQKTIKSRRQDKIQKRRAR
jgi:hypothetical protein